MWTQARVETAHLAAEDMEDQRIAAIALGTLCARYVREKPLNKENDFLLEGDWTIEF